APASARQQARTWLLRDHASARADEVEGPFILPIVDDHRVREYREVLRVMVGTTGPVGRWAVYVDAATGAPVAREQQLRFASGVLQMTARVRGPNGARLDFAAPNLGVVVNGGAAVTTIAGVLNFNDGGPANVLTSVAGTFIFVANEAGELAAANLLLPP